MQHHPHHRTTRPLLAMRRSLGRCLHQASTMQMQLGHRIAQCIAVAFAQLLVEMLHREAAVEVAIQPQHPLDLGHRSSAQRRRQTTIRQARNPRFAVAITPAAECAFADPKQLCRLHLTQFDRSERPRRP